MPDDDDLDFSDVPDDAPEWVKSIRKRGEKALGKAAEASLTVEALRKENALLRSGLELDASKTEALLSLHKGDTTPEALRATAVLYGWAQALPDAQAQQQAAADASAEAQADISAAGAGSSSADSGLITPDTVASWSYQRQRTFMDAHPLEWDELKQGQSVSVPNL